jgi:hypothetical protein
VKRGTIVVLFGVTLAVAVVVVVAVTVGTPGRPRKPAAAPAGAQNLAADAHEIASLRRIPFYRVLIEAKALRSVAVDRDGTVHLDADFRAALEPRLAALGLAGASELLPVSGKGTLVIEGPGAGTKATRLHESWAFDEPAAVFELLDRHPTGTLGSPAMDAIPGAPTSMACVQLMATRLADPALGGPAFASWRDRVSFAEKLIGRPLREELSQDLAGPAIFALYESGGGAEAQAILSLELKRSDRLASLLDMVFALGALTERGTIRRYRGVATGSFAPASGGPGLALAVDGPVLVVATSRERLESAIDARRAGTRHGGVSLAESDPAASWSAVSASAFVSHGWSRLMRSADEAQIAEGVTTAALRAEGATGWRLTGDGPAPAITADPMIPFLRSAFLRRQRDPD